MSGFMAALGGLGGGLLKKAGGWLLGKAQPLLSKIGSHFSNAFGVAKNVLGRSAMDRLYDTGVNAAIGGIHKFAKSDFL